MKKTIIILCLMLLSIFFEALAQSPGGVHGTEAWFITESKTDSLNGQYHWADYSGDSVRLIMKRNSEFSEFTLPRSDLRTFNFNPAIKVSHYDFFKSFNLTNSDLSQFTIIGAYAPYAENNSGILYSIKSATGTNTTICGESILGDDFSIPYNNDVYGNLNLSSSNTINEKEGALKILSHYHAEQPNKTLWGNSRTATVSIGIPDTISDNNTETLRTSNQSYQGYFPELAIYSRNLTPFERKRAVSYFALKYGVSLNHSYFLSDSTLIWDITSDSEYNNRITAVVNDSKSGLYQPLSTTSYEEYPNYSWLDNDTVDSYYLNNSMSAPSKYRLLVQGKEFANTIDDGKYYILGDNNLSTELSDSTLRINRNWLIKTNYPDSTHNTNINIWNGNGISILNKCYKNYLIQDLPQLVSAVTDRLITGDGAISFTYERLSGTIDVGFVSDASATQCNKAYRFTRAGRVFLMENGERTGTIYVDTSFDKKTVKVIKSGRNLILQIDGVGVYSTIIDDNSDNYYGFVSMLYTNGRLFSMNDVRVDGVYDNGNQLELGYISDDNDLHPSKNNAYLIIDRSGSGNFDDEDLEYIKPSRYDSQRNKLLFNNIYWDTDGNGSDVFSFGCVNCLYAETTAEAATVTDMQPNNDGKINIDIKAGTPAFIYRLRAAENPDSIIREGFFFMDSVCIKGIYPGEYELDITQLGGYDAYGIHSENNQDRYICSNNIVTNGEISWVYSGEKADGNYIVGFGSNNSVSYGIRVSDNNIIYAVSPNGETNIGIITEPQILSVSYLSSNGSMSYLIGNSVVHRVYGVTGNYQSIIEPINGDCQIYNFHAPAAQYMNTSVGMYTDYYNMCTVTKNITVPSTESYTPTHSVKSKLASVENIIDKNSNFKVYPKDNIERSFEAELYLDYPEPASLVVFDASGKLIHSSEFAAIGNIRSIDFNVPMAGVYVVKAITDTQEFTQKIISK